MSTVHITRSGAAFYSLTSLHIGVYLETNWLNTYILYLYCSNLSVLLFLKMCVINSLCTYTFHFNINWKNKSSEGEQKIVLSWVNYIEINLELKKQSITLYLVNFILLNVSEYLHSLFRVHKILKAFPYYMQNCKSTHWKLILIVLKNTENKSILNILGCSLLCWTMGESNLKIK